MSPVEFDATPDLLETVLTCRRGANVSCRVVPVLTCRAWACDGSKEVCVGLASVCPAVDIGCALAAAGGLTRLALGRHDGETLASHALFYAGLYYLPFISWSETNRGEGSAAGNNARTKLDEARRTLSLSLPALPKE